jgi:hypothetical protein
LSSPPLSPTPITLVTSTIPAGPIMNQPPPTPDPPASTPSCVHPSGTREIHTTCTSRWNVKRVNWSKLPFHSPCNRFKRIPTNLLSDGPCSTPMATRYFYSVPPAPFPVTRSATRPKWMSLRRQTKITRTSPFTLHVDAGDGCNPPWSTGTTENDVEPFVGPQEWKAGGLPLR